MENNFAGFALLAAILTNAFRDQKKSKPSKPEDFMPKKPKPRKRQTANEQLETVKRINPMLGGEIDAG